MSFFEQLQHETSTAREYLLTAPIIQQVFDGDFTLETYIAFLNQAYHHVRHTIPLLMSAGARLEDRQSWMRPVIAEYIEDEIGHERWILDDLEACGCDRQAYENGQPPFSSEVMVAYLYDFVARKNPVGIFGMVQVLEGTSSSLAPTVAEIVQRRLGLPDSAMTYLTTHGALDQDHIRFFEEAMDRIDHHEDRQAIMHVANSVYHLYGDVYRSLSRTTETQSRKDVYATG